LCGWLHWLCRCRVHTRPSASGRVFFLDFPDFSPVRVALPPSFQLEKIKRHF
jgi:hypothetical protein